MVTSHNRLLYQVNAFYAPCSKSKFWFGWWMESWRWARTRLALNPMSLNKAMERAASSFIFRGHPWKEHLHRAQSPASTLFKRAVQIESMRTWTAICRVTNETVLQQPQGTWQLMSTVGHSFHSDVRIDRDVKLHLTGKRHLCSCSSSSNSNCCSIASRQIVHKELCKCS